MEPIDIHQCQELEELENLIEEITDKLNAVIREENDLEITLLDELDRYPDIKDTLSMKNKFIKLRTTSDNPNIKEWVNEWVRCESKIRFFTNKKHQVEGKRDSKKKIFNILPR